jgi:AcrR family transcriptional regulator
MTDPHPDSGHRRDDILGIAARLFAETGFDKTTMRQIAGAAGIQAASLYHHFKTKDDNLDAILRDFLLHLPDAYNRIIAARQTPRQVIHDFVELALRTAIDNQVVLTIVIRERQMLAGRAEFAYVEAAFREIEDIWMSVLDSGVALGDFRSDVNLPVVLRMILDLVGSVVEWYRPGSRRYSAEDVVKTELGVIFGGISARSA